MPTASDLVTDLPADFEVFGQAVDTRLKALQPGTTLGDLAYSSATANTNTRLAIGTTGQVLAVSGGGVPEWTTTADVTPLTTKGDLFTFTTVDARIGVGANGTVLTADSAEATGLKWATPTSGGMTVIASGTLSGSTVTVSSIPATYNDLIIVVRDVIPSTDSHKIFIRFNGDTAGNYDTRTVATTGGTWPDTRGTLTGDTDNAVTDSLLYYRVLDYANATTWKMAAGYGLTNNNTTSANFNYYPATVFWRGTSAINSITIFPEGGTFGGTYIIYGVK